MSIFVTLFLYSTVLSLIMWLFSLVIKRQDMVDIVWGLGIAGAMWLAWFVVDGPVALPVIIVLSCVTLWALRLSIHIALRWSPEKEDFRYATWRSEWMKKGRSYFMMRSYLQVFLLQSVLMLVMAMPMVVLFALGSSESMKWWQWFGVLVWIEGMFFEVVGDWQLSRFIKKRKKGLVSDDAILDTGAWAWTRHPNYWGELELWWGMAIMCLVPAIGWLWVGFVAPIFITLSLRYLSGVPMLEAKLSQNQKYQEYMKKVNMLVPWFPKKIREKNMV